MNNDQMLNSQSVLSTFIILNKAIATPQSAPEDLIEACKSQGALAALVLTEYGIRKMSLNTMKTHADNNSKILWNKLNASRKDALKAYQKYQRNQGKPSRGSNAYMKDEIVQIKEHLQNKNNEIIQFVDCYQHLLTICRDYSKHDSMFAAKFENHLQKFSYLNKNKDRIKLRVLDGNRT